MDTLCFLFFFPILHDCPAKHLCSSFPPPISFALTVGHLPPGERSCTPDAASVFSQPPPPPPPPHNPIFSYALFFLIDCEGKNRLFPFPVILWLECPMFLIPFPLFFRPSSRVRCVTTFFLLPKWGLFFSVPSRDLGRLFSFPCLVIELSSFLFFSFVKVDSPLPFLANSQLNAVDTRISLLSESYA